MLGANYGKPLLLRVIYGVRPQSDQTGLAAVRAMKIHRNAQGTDQERKCEDF
jgi:hypothetical protein